MKTSPCRTPYPHHIGLLDVVTLEFRSSFLELLKGQWGLDVLVGLKHACIRCLAIIILCFFRDTSDIQIYHVFVLRVFPCTFLGET